MLIPAGIVSENGQVNVLLPLNVLVGGVVRSPALSNQQNKLPGTIMEESSVETNQGLHTGTASICRDYILTSCNPVQQLRPFSSIAPSGSIPAI